MTERVENWSEVVCSTVTVRVVTGVGLSGSKAEGPGSVNAQRVVCCEPPIKRIVTRAAQGVGMAGIRVIAKATDRIAKFREAKKMVRMSCDAASQREQAKLPPAIIR